jgi:hypothetical protein
VERGGDINLVPPPPDLEVAAKVESIYGDVLFHINGMYYWPRTVRGSLHSATKYSSSVKGIL